MSAAALSGASLRPLVGAASVRHAPVTSTRLPAVDDGPWPTLRARDRLDGWRRAVDATPAHRCATPWCQSAVPSKGDLCAHHAAMESGDGR